MFLDICTGSSSRKIVYGGVLNNTEVAKQCTSNTRYEFAIRVSQYQSNTSKQTTTEKSYRFCRKTFETVFHPDLSSICITSIISYIIMPDVDKSLTVSNQVGPGLLQLVKLFCLNIIWTFVMICIILLPSLQLNIQTSDGQQRYRKILMAESYLIITQITAL